MMNGFDFRVVGLSKKDIESRRSQKLSESETDHFAKDRTAFEATEQFRNTFDCLIVFVIRAFRKVISP